MEIPTPDHTREIRKIVDLLRASRSILFITGAGLSADSGLPTYRGVGGLYENKDAEHEIPIEDLLSKGAMQSRPEQIWKYLLEIEERCRNARPNRGHEVIAAMESRFERVWVLTQNVDGFHHRAKSKNVIDIHGDLHSIRCTLCSYRQIADDYCSFTIPPRCPECHSILRPDIILFGEQIPARQVALYESEIARGFDLVFSVGTTSMFPYISAPVLDAYHLGKPSIEINPAETDVTEFVTVKLPLTAAAALDAIWNEFDK